MRDGKTGNLPTDVKKKKKRPLLVTDNTRYRESEEIMLKKPKLLKATFR